MTDHRVRTGVARHRDGGWLVVTDVDGNRDHYGPPGGGRFPTEEAAQLAAEGLSREIRKKVSELGGVVLA